jgi:hypothetical protein
MNEYELQIATLQNLIKNYTTFQTLADTTRDPQHARLAQDALNTLNNVRLSLGFDAEMREVFYSQINVSTIQKTISFSSNDIAYIIKQGIAYLENGVTLSMINQGAKKKTITREPVAWQQLFATQQGLALGQQTVFPLPEALRFNENQALQISIANQTQAGFLFLHGCNLKANLENVTRRDLEREFKTEKGETIYLPETQLVPIAYQFPSNVIGTYATAPNGDENIFSAKNGRSVLLTHVSTTATNCRIDSLTDTGKNQTLAQKCEVTGIAADYNNAFTTWHPLPYPHLLWRGDRLKLVMMNGSPMQADQVTAADVTQYLCFKGITL